MRDLLFRCSAVMVFGLVPAQLWAAPKSQESYLVHPSTQTIQRREAVLALGKSRDAQSGPQLIEALTDKDPMTRSLAAQGLGTLKSTAAVPALSKVLAGDSVAEVRQSAAASLTQIGDPAAVDALGKALKDSAPNVRVVALTGLGRFVNPKTRPLVEAACKDSVVTVRRTAVYVLLRLEDPASIPTLKGLLKDSDAAVRAEAVQALGQLHAADSKPTLTALLKDPDPLMQASAARSLLMLDDSSGFETAKALDKNPDISVRGTAIDALGWSKDPAAETELESLRGQVPAESQTVIEEALRRTKQLKKQ